MKLPNCPDQECANHRLKGCQNVVPHGFYKTRAGKRRRFRCMACGKTFTSTRSVEKLDSYQFSTIEGVGIENFNHSYTPRVLNPAEFQFKVRHEQ